MSLSSDERTIARTPALLTTSKYLGTLATTRCLGRRGVPVIVAASGVLGPAQWSRCASRVIRGRRKSDPASMLAWLLDLGARSPGAVLHPTSDEMAWLIARHASVLAPLFHLYTPPFGAIRALLDKSELHRVAGQVGLGRPAAFFPDNEVEVEEVARHFDALVVKPRTQVFYESHAKGAIVSGPAEALRAWQACRASPHAESVLADAPGIDRPMLQERIPTDGVYSISGFVTRGFEVLCARGARKVLQRPSGVGVGVCFEAAPVEHALVSKIAALARAVGFFGPFEAEFVGTGGERRLIDFNPRYYGQMAFDIARGAPLPWMLHLGALGREDLLVAQQAPPTPSPSAYGDRATLRLILACRRMAGTLAPESEQKWKEWLRADDGAVIDATLAEGDPLPAVASVVAILWDAARHPRGFWRSIQGDM